MCIIYQKNNYVGGIGGTSYFYYDGIYNQNK